MFSASEVVSEEDIALSQELKFPNLVLKLFASLGVRKVNLKTNQKLGEFDSVHGVCFGGRQVTTPITHI